MRTVLSAAVLVGLLAVGFRLFGNDPRTVPSLLPGSGLAVAGVVISSNALVLLVLAVGLAPLPFLVVVAALLWLQRREVWDAAR